eukprot:6319165-Heterocapsa_arctica.AAC.1
MAIWDTSSTLPCELEIWELKTLSAELELFRPPKLKGTSLSRWVKPTAFLKALFSPLPLWVFDGL